MEIWCCLRTVYAIFEKVIKEHCVALVSYHFDDSNFEQGIQNLCYNYQEYNLSVAPKFTELFNNFFAKAAMK